MELAHTSHMVKKFYPLNALKVCFGKLLFPSSSLFTLFLISIFNTCVYLRISNPFNAQSLKWAENIIPALMHDLP